MRLNSFPAFLATNCRQSVKKILWLGLALAALSFLVLGNSGPAVVRAACAGGYGVNFVQPNGSPIGLEMNASPYSVVTADFNKDTKLDLATADIGTGKVSVLLGNGSGGFDPATNSPFNAGGSPIAIAVADFDGDTNLDLIVANNINTGTVSLLLGNGSGGFILANNGTFLVGRNPYAVATGDFNKDNKPDIVVANSNDNNVNVFLGDGAGSFTSAVHSTFSVGALPLAVGIGDFDKDGNLDFVVANGSSDNVSVMLGNGSGDFSPASNSPFALNGSPQSITIADFNKDGKLDLATADTFSNKLSVLLGDGLGGFSPATGSPITVANNPYTVLAGDYNGDGKLDLAAVTNANSKVSVLLGDDTGAFSPASSGPFDVDSGPVGGIGGDFNSDGKPDLATANLNGNSVSVLLNQPNLTVSSLQLTSPSSATAGTLATVTVTALDNCGDTFTDYSGTVAFSSTDTVADLPANYTFVAGDSGTKTFANGVKFYTGGSRSLTVTATLSNTLTASQNVTVTNFVVTANSDPVGASPPMGTLSYALKNVSPTNGQLITFKPGVTAVNVTGQLPNVPVGVTINGGSCASGTPVFINSAGGTGDGLVLKGGVTLQNLRVANFPGRQIVAGVTLGGENTLICTRASHSYT